MKQLVQQRSGLAVRDRIDDRLDPFRSRLAEHRIGHRVILGA